MTPALKLASALASAALAISTLAAPAIADPVRPSFLEGKADFHDKELALTYAFGPGALDFALMDRLSFGVGVDQVFNANSWYYRGTWSLVQSYEAGVGIAFNAGAIQTREQLAGNQFAAPVWGYQAGLLVSLLTDSGVVFRSGFQLYDTDWSSGGDQQVLITPEIAYRWELIEFMIRPSWPLTFENMSWVGIRVRI